MDKLQTNVNVSLNHCEGARFNGMYSRGDLKLNFRRNTSRAFTKVGESLDRSERLSPSQRIWVRVPRGPIPTAVQGALRARLERHAHTGWQDQCRGVLIRFRGAYAYVDALPSARETLTERRVGREEIPVQLCRLGYLGEANRWQYAFFKYSDMKYALSLRASGSFEATPEEAFDCSARVYLGSGT